MEEHEIEKLLAENIIILFEEVRKYVKNADLVNFLISEGISIEELEANLAEGGQCVEAAECSPELYGSNKAILPSIPVQLVMKTIIERGLSPADVHKILGR